MDLNEEDIVAIAKKKEQRLVEYDRILKMLDANLSKLGKLDLIADIGSDYFIAYRNLINLHRTAISVINRIISLETESIQRLAKYL